MKKRRTKVTVGSLITLVAVTLGLYLNENNGDIASLLDIGSGNQASIENTLNIPDFDGVNQELVVNDNQPDFTEAELDMSNGAWEDYSDLDSLNRVGPANALLGKELFPTEKREQLYINPTGWNQQKISGNEWLYNRSHLIGFQFTGQNNNPKNLMTGTRSFNSPGMQAHEDDIAYYIKQTNHHVRYRVTPYFEGEELVARGVQMEAQSIEDEDIRLNVFIYNVQDGYTINYETGRATKN